MFFYLKTSREFLSLVLSEIGMGYRDLSFEIDKNRMKVLHENNLPDAFDEPLNDFESNATLSMLLDQSDHTLNFVLLNDFDVGGEKENEIFRRGMVKKFGAKYFEELSSYMLEKNCQQVQLLTNKTLNKIKKLRGLLTQERQ